jgi:hypothetical protein
VTTPDELRAFADAYRAAEARGLPVESVSHVGWHAGARVGAGTANGRLLAYHDSGDEAECVFRAGQRTLFNIMRGGNRRPGETRPFSLWDVTPGICGTLVPDVVGVQVIGEDGTAFAADIVAHTFAADIELVPPPAELPESASIDERIDAVWEHHRQAYEKARKLGIRVHDTAGTVIYEGPLIVDN